MEERRAGHSPLSEGKHADAQIYTRAFEFLSLSSKVNKNVQLLGHRFIASSAWNVPLFIDPEGSLCLVEDDPRYVTCTRETSSSTMQRRSRILARVSFLRRAFPQNVRFSFNCSPAQPRPTQCKISPRKQKEAAGFARRKSVFIKSTAR